MRTAVIVDIDGTLTRRRWGGPSRETYRPEIWDPAARTPYDWHRVGEDIPNPAMIELTQLLHATGTAIIVTSGRSEICRDETAAWLATVGVPYAELHMARAAESDGHVPDSAVKRRIWDEHISGRYRVLCAYDDRDQVVAVWRDLGLMCCQVGPGAF